MPTTNHPPNPPPEQPTAELTNEELIRRITMLDLMKPRLSFNRVELSRHFFNLGMERGKREGIKSLRNQISICEWALANVHTHSDKEFHHNCITCLFDEAEGKLAAIRRGEKNGE